MSPLFTSTSVLWNHLLNPNFFYRSTVFALLLVANYSIATAQVTFNTTTPLPNMDFVPVGAGAVQVADINKDGLPDIIYATVSGGAVTYLQNVGGNSFATPTPNPFSNFTSTSPAGFILNQSSTIADFDGDGDLDIWVRVSGLNNDVFLRNDAGTYVQGTVISGMEFSAAGVNSVKVEDFNKDGYPDIIYNTGAGVPITYLQSNSGSSFSTPSGNHPFINFATTAPAGILLTNNSEVADFDGDGDLDLWARVNGPGNDIYLRNDGGTYVEGTIPSGLEFVFNAGINAMEVGDFNGDGLVDVIYHTAAAAPITYLQNNGGTSFSTPATNNPFVNYLSNTPAGITLGTLSHVADFDGDGDVDLWGRLTGAGNDLYAVASGQAPRVISKVPAHASSNVSVTTNITLTFSEPVFPGTGNFQIRRLSNNSIVESISATGPRVTGSGTTTITINPVANLAVNTAYYLTFDRTALADAQGVIPGGLDNGSNTREPASSSSFLQFTTSSALPVIFGDISATVENGTLNIHWSSLTEINNDLYEIEVSDDGETFQQIAIVSSKANSGNSGDPIRYEWSGSDVLSLSGLLLALFLIPAAARRRQHLLILTLLITATVSFQCNKRSEHIPETGNYYLRIAQVDKDGSKSYSKVVKVVVKQ